MAGNTLTPDLCILGGGGAGASLAMAAAALGLQTVLVAPPGPRPGRLHAGRALHALAAAAARVHAIRTGAAFGVEASPPAVDFGRIRREAQAIVADLARNEADLRLAALGVRVLRGEGRFMDADTVAAADHEIRARRFVLAPAEEPALPDIRGLSRTPHLTLDRLLELRELPAHLLVVGADGAALAVAQAFHRLGAAATVIAPGAALAGEDPECAAILLDALAAEGIVVRENAAIERIEGRKGVVRVALAGGAAVEGTHLLLACGWRRETGALGLDVAGIAHDEGGIRVAGDLRTTNRRVFVPGDLADALQAGRWHARLILAGLLFRLRPRPDPSLVARATATDPALAHAGLSEAEARERYRRIRVLRRPFAESDGAALARAGEGTVKIVTDARGRILGATLVGAGAGEQIPLYALAVAGRMPVSRLAGPLFPDFSRAAAGQEAALVGLAGNLTGTWARRIIAALRLFR